MCKCADVQMCKFNSVNDCLPAGRVNGHRSTVKPYGVKNFRQTGLGMLISFPVAFNNPVT